ncbi:MAG: hypothetical protein V1929_07690 [bacterium]
MSLWDSIGSLFKGKPGIAARDTARIYILDGERMLESRGGEKVGPLDRFQLLQRMAQFAEREKICLQIVFAGRPLREVAHGGTYKGVKVYYAEQPSHVADQVDKLLRKAGRNAVVFSFDSQTEQRVSSRGGVSMRIGTLRKALENGGVGGGDGDDSSRGRRHDRRMRPPRGGRRGEGRDGRDNREQREPRPDSQSQEADQTSSGEPGSDTTVKNLIDLVE